MCANTHICANTHMCANTQMCASAHTCVTEHGQIYQRQLIPHNLLNHQNEEIVIQKQNYKLFMNVFDLKYSFSQKLMKEFCICMNTNCMSIIYQEGKHLYRVPQRVQSPSHRGYATDQRASPESTEPSYGATTINLTGHIIQSNTYKILLPPFAPSISSISSCPFLYSGPLSSLRSLCSLGDDCIVLSSSARRGE